MNVDIVRWQDGGDHGLVWPGGMAMIDGSLDPAIAVRMWVLLHQGADLPGFLEGLGAASAAGLLGLPDFVIVLRASGLVQFAVRGAFVATVDSDDARILEGTGITTWAEHLVPDVRSIALGRHGGASGLGRPLIDGLVTAGRLQWRDPLRPRPVGGSGGVKTTRSDSGHLTADGDTPISGGQPLDESEVDLTKAAPAAEEVAADAWEQLWDSTIARSVEEAALRDTDDNLDGGIAISRTPESRATEEAEEWSAEWSRSRPTGSFASVPGGSSSPEHQLLRDPAALAPGERSRTFARERRLDDRTAGDLWDGLVLAALCSNAHPNPPGRGPCTICGEQIGERTVSMPQPTIGRLLFSTGHDVELNGAVIVGRNPRPAPFVGSQVPTLIPLAYAHISGTHLEIRTEGWRLIAIDPGSTNGTLLCRVGEPSRQVTSEGTELHDGDVLDLDAGITIVVQLSTNQR